MSASRKIKKSAVPSPALKNLRDHLHSKITALGFEQEIRFGGKIGVDSQSFSVVNRFTFIWIRLDKQGLTLQLERPRKDAWNRDYEYTFNDKGSAEVTVGDDPMSQPRKRFETWDSAILHFRRAILRELQRAESDITQIKLNTRRTTQQSWSFKK